MLNVNELAENKVFLAEKLAEIENISTTEIAEKLFRSNIIELDTNSMQIIVMNNYDDIKIKVFIDYINTDFIAVDSTIIFNRCGSFEIELYKAQYKDELKIVEKIVDKINQARM